MIHDVRCDGTAVSMHKGLLLAMGKIKRCEMAVLFALESRVTLVSDSENRTEHRLYFAKGSVLNKKISFSEKPGLLVPNRDWSSMYDT